MDVYGRLAKVRLETLVLRWLVFYFAWIFFHLFFSGKRNQDLGQGRAEPL